MNKTIKVLAVVQRLKPGGLENRLMDIIRNIDKSRVVIDVFSYSMEEGLFDNEVKKYGGKVYYNPPLTVQNMFWYVKYFRNFLKSHQEYKIVHAHQDAWCSVFCKGAYLAGLPVRIAHSRTAITGKSLENIAKNIIKLPTRKYANFYFAVSRKAGCWLYGEKLCEKGKVQIWPNAIDAGKFYYNPVLRKTVRENNKWNGRYVVMHVGNFTFPKNHPFIIEIFSEVIKKEPFALLVLVGTGDERPIINSIERFGLNENVQLLGSRQDVCELIQGADVFLFPSIFEGLPGALVEAQASGLPCVISDTIAEEVCIIPNVSALSLNESADCWSENVLRYRDYERVDAREYIMMKGFDIHSLTDKLCQFYEEAYTKGEIDESLRKTGK